jgi:hypothetical protein
VALTLPPFGSMAVVKHTALRGARKTGAARDVA